MSSALQENTATFVDVTSGFLEAAAALENRTRDAEDRNRALQQELRLLQQRAQHHKDQVRRWFLTIRRDHRSKSHARTGKTIRAALAHLASLETGPTLV